MTQKEIERRLAAVMIADVAGYSRLMGEDETGTLLALQRHRYSVVDPTIGQHRGRIVKTMGDGLLVEFRSVVEAVNCALDIQKGVSERNKDVPEDKQVRFRIGINLGEVLAEADDIYGDGVNIAARLETLAEPDGICISSPVLAQIEGEIDVPFTDLGAHKVKNIARPVRAFHHSPAHPGSGGKKAYRPFVDLPEENAPLLTGGCLCGAVRYEISEPELGSMYCECRMCQHFSGAPIIAGTTFPTAAVRFVTKEPKYYRSSEIAERGFCPECGSSIAYRGTVGQWTRWIMLFTASLDDPENHVPTYHLGVESAMPWLELKDDLPRTRCEDSPSLRQAWALVKKMKAERGES